MSGRPPLDATARVARQRKKKKLALDDARRANARVRTDIDESVAFRTLRDVERELDVACARWRGRARDANAARRPGGRERRTATVRVYVFHAHGGDGTYALRVAGRRVDERREDVDRGGASDGAWTHDEMEGRFTSYVRRMTIEVDGDAEEARTRTWTREGEASDALGTGRASGRVDGFEMRGFTKRGAVEATIRLEVNGMRERFRVGKDLAELIATRYASRRRVISELWTYFSANELVNEDDVSEVRVDEPMRIVFEDAGVSLPKSPETVNFQRVCDVACEKFLTALEPLEIKYNIKTSGISPSKPDCYDIEAEEPDSGPWGLAPPYEHDYRVAKDVDACEQHIRCAFDFIDSHLERRDFLLRFAESPIDFINSCVLNQAKGVYKAEDVTQGSADEVELRHASRASDAFREPWVDEAMLRLLE